MNLANKLTVLRIIMIPFVIFFMMTNYIKYSMIIALVLYVIACFTDTLDGIIARKYNHVTDFGKFLDPLADKMLVISILICFVELGYENIWIAAIIIIFRELAITGFRTIAASKNVVIAASGAGKYKAAFQMVWVGMLFVDLPFNAYFILRNIMMYIVVILTIASFVEYIYKNRKVIGSM